MASSARRKDVVQHLVAGLVLGVADAGDGQGEALAEREFRLADLSLDQDRGGDVQHADHFRIGVELGLQSLGFEVDNLLLVSQRLLAAGSPITRPRDNAEGFQEIITSDPDGNTIRLFAWPNG